MYGLGFGAWSSACVLYREAINYFGIRISWWPIRIRISNLKFLIVLAPSGDKILNKCITTVGKFIASTLCINAHLLKVHRISIYLAFHEMTNSCQSIFNFCPGAGNLSLKYAAGLS